MNPATIDRRLLEGHAEVEQNLLSGGYNNPRELVVAAERYALCGDSFTSEEHSIIFAMLVECGLREIQPSIQLVCKSLRYYQIEPNQEELSKWLPYLEVLPSGLNSWARMVSLASRGRTEARKCYQKAGEILADLAGALAC